MRASELRPPKMAFQKRSDSQDALGGQKTNWVTVFTEWVGIEPLSGRELFAAQAVNSEVTYTIKTRYRAEFADPRAVAALRGVYKGRIFNIHTSIIVDERNREVQILASESLNDG